MPKLYYFRAPNFDISPDSATAPRLGSIFSGAGLKRLTSPLNQSEYVTIPSHLSNSSVKTGFSDTASKSVHASGGAFAEDTSGVASAELIYEFAQDRKNTYACDLLETDEFDPTVAFVQECIASSKTVQEYIQESFVGYKTVYMITGLKTATGFRMGSATATEQGPSLKVGVSAVPFGVPAEAGPKGDLKYGTGRDMRYGGSSKIVFAYRAIKISSRRDGSVTYKDVSGGQYGLGDEEEEAEDDAWDVELLDEENIASIYPGAQQISVDVEGGA